MLAAGLRKAHIDSVVAVKLRVFFHSARQNKVGGRVNRQIQKHQLLKNLVVVDGILQIRQVRTQRDRLQARGECADGACVIVFLNVLAGTGNRDAVQQLKKVEVQHLEQIFGCAVARLPLAPCIKCPLRISENFVNRTAGIEFFVNIIGVSFVSQGKLIFQVIEAVVDRRGGEHQHLCFHACTDDLFHQGYIAIVLGFFIRVFNQLAAVAEVVGFINHDKIVVAPIQSAKIQTV